MEECKPILNTGLRGLTVATTKISDVDGNSGKIVYRGYLAKELAEKVSFEEVIYLLLYEKLPSSEELKNLDMSLRDTRELPPSLIDALKTRPKGALPMDILQAGVAMLAHHCLDIREKSIEAAKRRAIRLIAQIPSIVAAWDRIRNDREPIPPNPKLNHAANLLYILTGEEPDEEIASFLNAALILHAEHAFNASTFAAREVASTQAHMYAAVTAAIGSLSGNLHGGANTKVMEMLVEIGSVDKVEEYVNNILASGERIMGLGHAIYQTDDPRALILKPMAKRMSERSSEPKWFQISEELERRGKTLFKEKKGREIFINVDFYSASFYHYVGIPTDLFTPVFAISRVVGWAAHIIEEQFGGAAPKPVLYRPDSKYIGDYCGDDVCPFIPIEER